MKKLLKKRKTREIKGVNKMLKLIPEAQTVKYLYLIFCKTLKVKKSSFVTFFEFDYTQKIVKISQSIFFLKLFEQKNS